MLAEAAGPDQCAAKKMRSGHCAKNSIPGVLRWRFLGPIHHLTKATLPCWKILDRRQLFFLAVPPWPVIKILYVPLELHSAPGAGPQKVYQTSMGQGYKCKGNNNEGGFTKLKTSKRYKWILALTAAFVQQDHFQRDVSRWFTYLTDRTSGCIDKK